MHQVTDMVSALFDDARSRIGRCCGGRVVFRYNEPTGAFGCAAYFISEHDTVVYLTDAAPLTADSYPASFLRSGAAEAMEVLGTVSVRGYVDGRLV